MLKDYCDIDIYAKIHLKTDIDYLIVHLHKFLVVEPLLI